MIIVVEGISAAGKTTWCRAHAPHNLICETFPDDRHLQPQSGPINAAYWTRWNAKRWNDALAMEAEQGQAVCDTDPLKLHYTWCHYRIGLFDKAEWHLHRDAAKQAFLNRQLGFADAYFVKRIDPVIARRQRDADVNRIRNRFEVHVLLQPPLIRWYQLLETVLGGRVQWQLPDQGPGFTVLTSNPRRHDIAAFDDFMALLDQDGEGDADQ
ncbi:hypothetical protein [Agrobacterium sp.]|uniref:hypothetical protein n=1 Tax=Agrobacterium sp. TaxID=361 RepID=UPI0028A8007C|nr:hypothetical protein [Agrobacterium sp.]